MHCRCVSLLLSLFLCIPAFAQTQPSTEEKILATLHGQDNRVGIAGYLKARHPAFYQEAVQGGLAEWLDGKIDFQAFRSKLTSNPPLADVLGRVTGGGKLAPPSGPKVADVQTAGALDDPLKMADTLQSSFYQGPRHPLAKILSPQWWKTVGINGGQGKLVWFNPYVDIPELGIKAGEPMTPAQRGALLKLFAVDTTGKSAPGTVGTGFHPKDVGRAVNPNPGVVTILTEQGALVPEIVSKGAGPTSTTSRDGRLDLSEAYMDSEVSRNLQKAGAAVYVPVLVIDIGNDKAIYVRAAGSLLRQGDLSGFSAAEIEGLMNYVMGNRTMNPPAPRVLKTWAEEINPKTIGRNAGLMSGMGLKHGSLSSDNYGLRGELVDWGWAELGHRGSDDQKQYQLDMVEAAVKAANPAIAREEIRSLDRSGLERVATANAMSFAAGDTDDRMRFRLLRRMEGAPSILEGVDRATLELIAKANHVSTYSSDTDVELNERIVKKLQQKRASGLIQGVDRPTLEKIALANGMNVQPNDTDVQISDKLTAEVKEWGKKATLAGLSLQVDVARAKTNFETEYQRGKTDGSAFKVTLAEQYIRRTDESTLRDLAKGFGSSGGLTKDQLIDLLKRNGVVDATADVKDLPGGGTNARVTLVGLAVREVGSAGQFGVAYLIKESVRALETRDVEQMKQAMRRMGTGRFWMDLGVFSAASGGVQATLGSIPMSGVFRPFFFRTALPLATGMAAVQAMSGHFSVVDLAIDGSSFLVAGLAVQHVADGAMFLLRGATPTGIVYGIGKLAATLYLGEKLGDELRRRMRRDAVHRIGSDGVSQKLEVLSN